MTDANTPDRDLLTRISRGQRDALAELARRYEQPLLGLARGLLGGGGYAKANHDTARDAVQDVWVRVIKYAQTYKGNSEVRTWLYRLLINRCRDVRSAEATWNGRHKAAMTGDHEPAAREQSVGSGDEFNQRLHAAMWELPASTRLLLLLCYHRGLTHEQAADVLEIPVGTLKSRLHAALKTLRATLASEVGP